MKEYLTLETNKKEAIVQNIKQTLIKETDIIFAFIFGSFLDAPSFRDIDIGIYATGIKEDEVFDCELKLSKEISDACDLPFDIIEVKVLNFAPGYFLNNIFSRGKLLFSKDQQLLSEMIENTSLDALANEHIAYQSLKELVPA